MRLLVATRNPGKLSEIKAIFNVVGLELVSPLDFPDLPEVVEDGDTLEANAAKKAVVLARAAGLWALADDTGLEVDALNGAPGVWSARYAGEEGNADRNCSKLLKALEDTTHRQARFRTVIALSDPSGACRHVEAVCPGCITRAPRGSGGFGYDPLFEPDGYDITFAEMGAEEKNRISHRARALADAREAWGERLARDPSSWPPGDTT